MNRMNFTWYMCKYCMRPFNLAELMAHNREFHPHLARDRSPTDPPPEIGKTEPLLPVLSASATDKEDGLNNNASENEKSYQELTPCPIVLESEAERDAWNEVPLLPQDVFSKNDITVESDEDILDSDVEYPKSSLTPRDSGNEEDIINISSDSVKTDDYLHLSNGGTPKSILNDSSQEKSTVSSQKLRRRSSLKFACRYCGQKFEDSEACQLHEVTERVMFEGSKSKAATPSTPITNKQVSNDITHTRSRARKNQPRKERVLSNSGFKCPQCGWECPSEGVLQRHMMYSHTRTSQYACSFCGNRFLNNASLKRHLIVHTGEKPYGCSQCDMKFGYSHVLKAHVLNYHSGAPFSGRKSLAFTCRYCDFTRTRRHVVEAHELSHSEASSQNSVVNS